MTSCAQDQTHTKAFPSCTSCYNNVLVIELFRLFQVYLWANELSKSFYRLFFIAICLQSHEVSGQIIFSDTFPETYLNFTCSCHFLHHKVSVKYMSGKILSDSWKNVMILAKNYVNDYLDARVCHSLQKILSYKILRCGQKIRENILL